MRGNEVDDALLDVRPDRRPRLVAGRRTRQVTRGRPDGTQIRHWHNDLQVPLLGGRRRHDVDRPTPREETCDLLDGPHGRGQPDPLRGPLQQGVEPLKGQRQMRPPFGARDGVDLIEDDRLNADQRLAGRGGEHEEQ
ncbi:MAG: hypothetical protein IPP00_10950 [Actinomycetales bacterium]|uniref:Uncharacterized protein n=1 Tax=Candidatus Phosphoribacter hodrii TaxID=2953743 RepID=A0A9D7Y2H5_9MICO|nr:hypothetical protein [Candidatus Phosphoribacter hodrii]